MFVKMCKAKIHRATVTEADLHYVGSITIDRRLLRASGILPGEAVHVLNNNNGERLETYVIEGAEDSGTICLNGAAARLVQPGDTVIVIAYAWMPEEEAVRHAPRVVFVDGRNRIVDAEGVERHGEIR